MEAKDVRKGLKEDIDNNVYRDVSRRLNIPFEEIQPILEAENEHFYKLKNRFYGECYIIPKKTIF